VFVGDSSFAVLDLLAAVREHCTVISRLRLDANLFASVPPCRPRKRGRRPVIRTPPAQAQATAGRRRDGLAHGHAHRLVRQPDPHRRPRF
jgi:hypothetical protein